MPGDVDSASSDDSSDTVKVFVYATRSMRGPEGKKWEFLPEEPAWTKLAKDGMENFARNLASDGAGHKRQLSDMSRGSPGKYTPILTESPSLAKSSCAQLTPLYLRRGNLNSLLQTHHHIHL